MQTNEGMYHRQCWWGANLASRRTGLEEKITKGHRDTTYRPHQDLSTSLNILPAGGVQL